MAPSGADMAGRTHSQLSPSGAATWLACPGSVALAEKAGPGKSSAAADEGTTAHKVFELSLLHKKNPAAFIGLPLEGQRVTDEMADAVSVAVDYVRKYGACYTVSAEALVKLPDLDMPGQPGQGHVDAVLWCVTGGILEIIDYKHGRGHAVDAIENPQMRLYAHGAVCGIEAQGFRAKKIICTIIQPRADHPAGRIRSETLTPAKLATWMGTVRATVSTIRNGLGGLCPSTDACRWCKGKAICPALAKQAADVCRSDFAGLIQGAPIQPAAVPAALDNAALAGIYANSDTVRDWLDAVDALIRDKIQAGASVGDLKLIAGRSTRKWKPDADVAAVFVGLGRSIDDIMPRGLVGIGEAEKLLPAKIRGETMDSLTFKQEGKPTLASGSDPRPSIVQPKAADDFSDILG